MKARFLGILLGLPSGLLPAADSAPPEVLVPGWSLSLFAGEPDIVTPVGIAVDGKGRVFTVENHTHQVKEGYAGPKTDRVKIYEDTDGDGKSDKTTVFAEGFTSAMNLAFSPDGVLHLVHRNGVLRLEDDNRDGVCDRQVPLLTLDTKETYPHNGLSGIAFSQDGYVYIGSGENFGTLYRAKGTDGTEIAYTPGGANIFRMKPDGTGLEIFATGLWNAFVLAVDGAGRVLVADNDPDSRPPCRLLHVVPGGDYGYQFQYGRSGLHPFVCWNGELPGTLPMAAGTWEAPTGILDARLAKLGPGRGDGFLLTEWGDSMVSWFRLQPRGASVSATREPVLRGGPGFRPACLAAAPDGSVYLTDWADREYSVHGKGRIWRLKATEPGKTPADASSLPLSEAERRRAKLEGLSSLESWPELKTALTDSDPFLVSAALSALRNPVFLPGLLTETRAPDPGLRLGALIALHRAGWQSTDPVPVLRAALADDTAAVRREAMRQAAALRLKDLRPDLEKTLEAGGAASVISPEDFTLWLAAMDLISRDTPPTAGTISASNDDLLQKLLADPATTPGIKAAVLPLLTNFKAPAMIRTLMGLSASREPVVRQEAVRSLTFVPVKAAAVPLRKIALSAGEPPELRFDAIQGLAGRETAEVLPLLPLLTESTPGIALETVRALRTHTAENTVRTALTIASQGASPEMQEALALALGNPPPAARPGNLTMWSAAVAHPLTAGQPDRGRRVFFSPVALCSTCHTAQGRGVAVGPDLSTIARSSGREKLIQSILEPSREIGPLHGVRMVTRHDGSIVSGVPSLKDGGGNLDLLQPGGGLIQVERGQILKVEDSNVSLMPAGLERNLTVQDFCDLVAWLETLK